MNHLSRNPSRKYGLSERVRHLEEVNRWMSDTLEFAVSFGDFQANVIPDQELGQILSTARLHLKRLMQFRTMAFLIVNESDFDFVLVDCEPESDRPLVQKELDFQIAKGVFAWAVHQNRAVTVPTEYFNQPLILHPLVTRLRVVGMFAGILDAEESNRISISSNLLTLLLFNLAHALENAALYRKINDQNQNLEEMIQRRTEALRRALEEADLADHAKNQFLANISHEIRTPLNAVIGFTDLLLDSPLNREQVEYGEMIRESGENLLALINDILDFSKAEAGHLSLEKIDFDPLEVAYDVCEMIGPKVSKKPIEVLCRKGKDLPSTVKGDRLRFKQVLINMMENAVKFTESGEIEISLELLKREDGRLKLHVKVRDTGIGIPANKLATIFEPFQQADGSTTRNYGGSGLGLAICKQIARVMNGDVWVESEPNQGSTFHFTAWLEKSEQRQDEKFTSAFLSNKRVLLVDDRHTHLEILTQALESVKMQITVTLKLEEIVPALQRAAEAGEPFDFCFINVQMRSMNGYEAVKEIRQAQLQNLLLIALSSSLERNPQRWEDEGFDGFLTQPVCREKLFQMLERCSGKTKNTPERGTDAKAIREKSDPGSSTMRPPPPILVVEDNPVSQKVATKMLEKLGCKVDVAINGLEAVKQVEEHTYDLVFMDCQMPGIDGYEVTTKIREWEGASRHTPIVAMTAHAMKGDRERCLDAGMDDYIAKPIKMETVFEMIKKWVRREGDR